MQSIFQRVADLRLQKYVFFYSAGKGSEIVKIKSVSPWFRKQKY